MSAYTHTHSHSPALTHNTHHLSPCAPLPEPVDKGPLPLLLLSPAVAPLLPLAEAIGAEVAFPKEDSIARLLNGGVPVMV